MTCRPTKRMASVRPSSTQAANCATFPPYSPAFNPIANAFFKLKALFRAKAERSVDALWNTVGEIVKLFEPQECADYFAAA